MSEPFVGEIRLVPYSTIIPSGWMACNGQSLQVNQNQALYSLIGNFYGGSTPLTFNLPDLRGRVPAGFGATALAPSLGAMGAVGGTETVALTPATMPAHTHALNAVTSASNEQLPAGDMIASGATASQLLFAPPTNLVPLNPATISNQGGGVPHNNMQPFLVLQYIIATQGLYPQRS